VLGFVITVKGMYHVLSLMSITCGRALMGGCVVIVEKITGILKKTRYTGILNNEWNFSVWRFIYCNWLITCITRFLSILPESLFYNIVDGGITV